MKITNVNDYKQPLLTVFGLEWESSNQGTNGDGSRWSEDEKIKVLKYGLAGLNVHEISSLLPSRSAYAIQLRLGKLACAIVDGANKYGRNYSNNDRLN